MARPTFATLALIEQWLHDDLIAPVALDRLKALSQRWPPLFSSCYLECRLDEGESRLDFLGSITDIAPPGVESDLARAAAELAPLGEGDPAWARVVAFARAWADPASPLRSHVPLLWLEFDDVSGVSGVAPSPSFHACIDRGYMGRGREAKATAEGGEDARREALAAMFEVLYGRPLPEVTAAALAACVFQAPAEARMIHVSAMLSRSPPAIKLYGCLPREALWRYLSAIGWPGDAGELRRLLTGFCAPSTIDDTIYVDLAIEERLTPYLGVVFSQPQLGTADNRDPRREALLERLVSAGLSAPRKRDALLRWPGSARAQYPGSADPMRIARWLDIKLTYHPAMPARAKAYLGFMPRFSLF